MTYYSSLILYSIYAFFTTLIIAPFVISFIKKEKVKQVILNYVESHSHKQGTPTMGGIIFLISISIVSLICFRGSSLLAKMTILVFLAFGILGFLDDFIKFKFKRNLGLKAYQKIIFQVLISFGLGLFVYKTKLVSSVLIIPFTSYVLDVGFWIIPFVMFVYIATTNAVNLTDGLDGLASSTTISYMFSILVLILLLYNGKFCGISDIKFQEIQNLCIVAAVSVGAIFSFVIFNCFPAKIFMGDTGSLALGSLVASVAVFSNTSLYLPILGVMFVLSVVSVIIQVAYYKLTRKRIFLMAPLHHHFEQKGIHEVRITMCYVLVTLIIGAITIIFSAL